MRLVLQLTLNSKSWLTGFLDTASAKMKSNKTVDCKSERKDFLKNLDGNLTFTFAIKGILSGIKFGDDEMNNIIKRSIIVSIISVGYFFILCSVCIHGY